MLTTSEIAAALAVVRNAHAHLDLLPLRVDLLVADAQKDLTANAAPDFDLSPEGLEGFEIDGNYYIAYSNEVSNTTSVYQLTPIPEPETYALMLMGLAAVGAVARRRRQG